MADANEQRIARAEILISPHIELVHVIHQVAVARIIIEKPRRSIRGRIQVEQFNCIWIDAAGREDITRKWFANIARKRTGRISSAARRQARQSVLYSAVHGPGCRRIKNLPECRRSAQHVSARATLCQQFRKIGVTAATL